MDETLNTVCALARAAGCSEATVRNADRAGAISSRRDTSGRRVFAASEIEKLRQYLCRRKRRVVAAAL